MKHKDVKNQSLLPTLLLILGVFAAGECFCRILDAYDGWKKYHELLGKTAEYRGQTYSLSKPKGVARIILLGGSAVHDTVQDYRDSWPYFLEQMLEKKTGKNIELINMGFYSESSIDELFKLNEFALDLHPDLVIVFDGQNDFYNAFHHFDYYKRLYELKNKIIFQEKKHDPFTRFFSAFRKQSSLYKRLNSLKKQITLKLSNAAAEKRKLETGPSPAPPSEPQKEVDSLAGVGAGPSSVQFFENPERWQQIAFEGLEIYGENLDKMARLIQKGKAKGLFIFQPDLSYKAVMLGTVTEAERQQYLRVIGVHEKSWSEIQKLTYTEAITRMKSVAEKYGIPFCDFNVRFFDGTDVHDLFDGNVHFSARGRPRIAAEISEIILKNKLI